MLETQSESWLEFNMNRETPTKDLFQKARASDNEFELNSQSSKNTKRDTLGESPKVKVTELDEIE